MQNWLRGKNIPQIGGGVFNKEWMKVHLNGIQLSVLIENFSLSLTNNEKEAIRFNVIYDIIGG